VVVTRFLPDNTVEVLDPASGRALWLAEGFFALWHGEGLYLKQNGIR
jgi:hypothetical protein